MQHARNIFVILTLTLLGFGVLMVHSASLTARPSEAEQIYLSRHLTFVAVGAAAALFCVIFPKRYWKNCTIWLLAGTVMLLVATLVPGIGKQVNGARRWLPLGPFSLQPSEIAKIALPMFLGLWLSRRSDQNISLWSSILPLLAVGTGIGLVLIQPDLGTSLFLCAGCALTLFIGGWPIKNFVICGLLLVPLMGGLLYLKPYQVKRITGFVETWQDINNAPYQIQQAFVSIADGGLWGVGLGKGWQKLSYLPEANTDFVFAVVAEELGMVGACGVIVLWCGIFFFGWRLLRPLPRTSFEFIVGYTLLLQVVLQAALNVAVVTALVPPKGIPHPLLSYGGSNLVVSLMSLGLVIGLSRASLEAEVAVDSPSETGSIHGYSPISHGDSELDVREQVA